MLNNENIILSLIIIIIAVVLFVFRSRKKRYFAANAGHGSLVSRLAESMLLFILAMLLPVFCFSNYGNLEFFERMTSQFFRVHITVGAVVLALLIISALIAFFWRGNIGIDLAASTIVMYSVVLNFGFLEKITPYQSSSEEPVNTDVSFECTGKFAGGEELWVNGVFLGELPLTISIAEFKNKVPKATNPPEDFKEQMLTYYELGNVGDIGTKVDYQYYARFKWQGQWVEMKSFSRGYNGYQLTGNSPNRKELIARDEHLFAELLRKARLNNYDVDDQWCETFNSYKQEGNVITLHKMAKTEPGFNRVIDCLTRHKYNITSPVDEQIARRVYREICREADLATQFDTGSIEARALELVFEKLNVKELVTQYANMVKSRTELCLTTSSPRAGLNEYSVYIHDKQGVDARSLPASASVLWYTLLLWDKKLDIEQPASDNIIESKIPSSYISSQIYLSSDRIEMAMVFGGSIIEKYLERNYLRAYEEGNSYYLEEWLKHLMQLDSPLGKKYRAENPEQTIKIVRDITSKIFNHDKIPPDFLFEDLNLGQKSLAVEFWPIYTKITNIIGQDFQQIQKQFAYLARLDELATEDMYVQCLTEFVAKDRSVYNMELAFEEIPMAKRLKIIRQTYQYLKDNRKDSRRYESTMDFLDCYLVCLGDEQAIDALLALNGIEKENKIQQVGYRLNNIGCSPGRSEMLAVLARHKAPELRQLSIKYLQQQPVKENLALLQTLAADSDPAVKQAAQTALAELEKLRLMPYSELVSLQEDYAAGKLK